MKDALAVQRIDNWICASGGQFIQTIHISVGPRAYELLLKNRVRKLGKPHAAKAGSDVVVNW